MTDEELAAIRERAEKATPGPWFGEGAEVFTRGDASFNWIPTIYHGRSPEQCRQQEQDAAFIAHARTDIPALLAQVERLRAENAQQSEWIAALMDEQPRYATANARLTTENAALREIVQAVAGMDVASDAEGHWRYCLFCSWYADDYESTPEHAPDCPVTKAQALLASETLD